MAELKLKTLLRTEGNNLALKDGTVKPRTFDFDFAEVPVLIDGFRRMVRGLEFDISEMAISTYICAKAYGKRFTACPIFVLRAIHHGAIVYNTKSGIRSPKDLEGKKVGLNRGYTFTTGVWVRGILQQEYGVDLNKITWVLDGDDHVAEYVPPPSVVPIERGKSLQAMLASGELAAVIGVDVNWPDVKPLIPDAFDRGLDALRQRGLYPINHLIVVKDELLDKYADLAPDLFNTFAEAKRIYVRRLKAGEIDQPTKVDRLHQRVMEITGDPLPYGIAPNRRVLEELIQHSLTQGIISRPITVEELFPSNTHDLVA